MAYQDFTTLEANERDQLACTLASLLLHDEGRDTTADELNLVLKAANVTVAPYWTMLLGKALDGKNVGDYLAVSGGGAGPVGQAQEEKKEEQAEEEEEEEDSDVDMDMGDLFG